MAISEGLLRDSHWTYLEQLVLVWLRLSFFLLILILIHFLLAISLVALVHSGILTIKIWNTW